MMNVPVSNCTGEMRFCAACRELAGTNFAVYSTEEDLHEMARVDIADFELDLDQGTEGWKARRCASRLTFCAP